MTWVRMQHWGPG